MRPAHRQIKHGARPFQFRGRRKGDAELHKEARRRLSVPGLAKIMSDQPKSHRIAASVRAIGASKKTASRLIRVRRMIDLSPL
jgi:hypothetical protein